MVAFCGDFNVFSGAEAFSGVVVFSAEVRSGGGGGAAAVSALVEDLGRFGDGPPGCSGGSRESGWGEGSGGWEAVWEGVRDLLNLAMVSWGWFSPSESSETDTNESGDEARRSTPTSR